VQPKSVQKYANIDKAKQVLINLKKIANNVNMAAHG
jgi:hypothetical protein